MEPAAAPPLRAIPVRQPALPRKRLALDLRRPGGTMAASWGEAITPQGDTPKHRVLLIPPQGRIMSSPNTISLDKLNRLIGLPKCPQLIDVRNDEDFAADPRLIPGSIRRPYDAVQSWSTECDGPSAVVICQRGLKLSHGAAA